MGRPGIDFPVLRNIPATDFNCRDVKRPGYYADLATDCQVFHICDGGRKISFLCPNGTIFRQSHLICDWWFRVDCGKSVELYEESAEQLAADQKIYQARSIERERRRKLGKTATDGGEDFSDGEVYALDEPYDGRSRNRNSKKVADSKSAEKFPSYYRGKDDNRRPGDKAFNRGKDGAGFNNEGSFNGNYQANSYTSEPPNYPTQNFKSRGSGDGNRFRENIQGAESGSLVDNLRNSARSENALHFDAKPPEFKLRVPTSTERPTFNDFRTSTESRRQDFFRPSTARPDTGKRLFENVASTTPQPLRSQNLIRTTPKYFTTEKRVAPEQNSFFSTTERRFTTGQNSFFSTTEKRVTPAQNSFFSTTERRVNPGQNSFFSTTERRATPGQNTFFSTTEKRVFPEQNSFFSTTERKRFSSTTTTTTLAPTESTEEDGLSTEKIPVETVYFKSYGDDKDVSTTPRVDISLSQLNINKPTPQSEVEKKSFEDSVREGLEIPPSSGPNALRSFALYFAGNGGNPFKKDRDSKDTKDLFYIPTVREEEQKLNNVEDKKKDLVQRVDTIIKDSTSTTGDHSPAVAALPNSLTQQTRDSYSALFDRNHTQTEKQVLTVTEPDFGTTAFEEFTEDAEKINLELRKNDLDGSQSRGPVEPDSNVNQLNDEFSKVSPDLRELAQVFTKALSAYLDDPEAFRKVLSEIRPTEPSATETSTNPVDYPSVTQEDDEVLDFSDVTKSSYRRRTTTAAYRETTTEYITESPTTNRDAENFVVSLTPKKESELR
ncbi:UNVERIFIED_CONTAM: hypothetical protein PYX00_003627 [Menopon gallinae]|uniref:Chitin-binding type-2 domain-containing protein n=1 Tax=Menopon gallinae TaxID=328185 RepID=A0AAW2I145_9NEOP